MIITVVKLINRKCIKLLAWIVQLLEYFGMERSLDRAHVLPKFIAGQECRGTLFVPILE